MAIHKDKHKYLEKVDKSVQLYKKESDDNYDGTSLYSEGDSVCGKYSEYSTFSQEDLIIGLLDKVEHRLDVIEGMIKDIR
jgi:hypothetical protein